MKINELIIVDGVATEIYREMTPEEETEVYKSIRQMLPRADRRIEKGKYFSANGETYKAITIIPAGDAIIPGTNCQKTNLAEALNALNT